MTDGPPKLSEYTAVPQGTVISKETLVGLGAEQLAQLVLDGAASDPGLLEELRSRVAHPEPETPAETFCRASIRGDARDVWPMRGRAPL